MNRIFFGFLISCLFVLLLVIPVSAQTITTDDARSVAENWIALKIQQQGDWGGSKTAKIGEVQEFKNGDRVIGYFCPVQPQGFLVISLRRELAPVKAYSDTSNLDPNSDEGLTDLIKGQMTDILDAIEQEAGPVASVSSGEVTKLMEFNYLQSWDVLDSNNLTFQKKLQSGQDFSNYQEGGILLSSQWHQWDPYYQQIPYPPPGSTCQSPHCTVGCGPLMAGQIMRYWAWPPYKDQAHPYKWPLMANKYFLNTTSSRWEDENRNPLTQADIDAVARLVYEIGIDAGADYCTDECGTSTYFANYPGKDMLDMFEDHFRYSGNADDIYRDDYSAVDWYKKIKTEINVNRPIFYHIKNHFIGCDGWREFYVGSNLHQEYHMNYGGALASTTWYLLEGLPSGGVHEESMLENLYPAQSLSSLTGTYPLQSFPYRYFDQDASGNSASFSAGQYLQFLPGVKVTCNNGTGSSIRFEGSGSPGTRLFTRGDISKGLHIYAGTLKLNRGGSIRLL